MWSSIAVLASLGLTHAAQVPAFVPPSQGPLVASPNYVGVNNNTLPIFQTVPGLAFNRFIQIWMENTDFATTLGNPTFKNLTTQGLLLDQYFAVTHPSEPNYLATVGGDFWGAADDNFYNIPPNISTIVDLLEQKDISWASYQENMPTDGFGGFSFSSVDYLDTSQPPRQFYVRKHNPLIIYDSVANVPDRLARHRNFNDFAADVNASALPQWMFITPNLVNDGHDTDIDFQASWINYFLVPLLQDSRFNDENTLILVTNDENENSGINNNIFSLLLGGAVPAELRGTVDSTFHTHFSALSTVEANWQLGSLGRGDTNKTLSNVYSFVAEKTGYQNLNITGAEIPLLNISGLTPGPLNQNLFVPFLAPNLTAVGAGGGPVFVAPTLNTSLTTANAPAPVDLTALGETVPSSGGDPVVVTPMFGSPE
ncbi:phosphoesterase family-domain-containing protein [Gautieria morchelliformis]|nr:phosphoesterase family-domain-containing protein [Gautieria morchelliformis]